MIQSVNSFKPSQPYHIVEYDKTWFNYVFGSYIFFKGARAWQRIDVAACKSSGEGSMRRKEGGGRFVVAGERKGSQGIANLEEGRRSWKIVDAVGRSV